MWKWQRVMAQGLQFFSCGICESVCTEMSLMPPEFRTKNLAVEFAKICLKIKTPQYLGDQLKRAACSVALNLSEGSAKNTKKDRHRYYRIALGSFRETEVILDIIGARDKELVELKKHLAGSLVNLCKSTSSS
jgi:four helix bundle protein